MARRNYVLVVLLSSVVSVVTVVSVEIPLTSPSMSSAAYGRTADLAVDGKNNQGVFSQSENPDDHTCIHTYPDTPAFWMADMGSRKCVGKVILWNMVDCCAHRLDGGMLKVGDNSNGTLNPVCDTVTVDQVGAGMVIELHCETMGRYLTIELPGTIQLHICEIKAYEGACLGHAWHLVYRAASGVPNPDPYDLWMSDSFLNDNIPEAKQLTNQFKGHYKSKIIRQWDKLDISEVKVSLYKDGSPVKEIVFDGSGSDRVNWLTLTRMTSSPWSDLGPSATHNYFSVQGYIDGNRRFYINRNHDGCNSDAGWLVMLTRPDGCDWGNPSGLTHPIFLFSNEPNAITWSAAQLGVSVDAADVFAIFVKIPRRPPVAPGIMHSNARLSGSPTTNPDSSFGQCNTECQLNNACTSFNHNMASMTCELNTVETSEAGLDQVNGWDFYPVNRNPGGKCAGNPCENSGFCQLSSNVLGYRCLCQPANYGTNCQH